MSEPSYRQVILDEELGISDNVSSDEGNVLGQLDKWLGVRWMCIHPVYGSRPARLFHHIFLLIAVAYSFWMALCSSILWDFLQEMDAPKHLEYGKWLFFLHLAATSIRLFLAERIIESPEASRLLAAARSNHSLHGSVSFEWTHSAERAKYLEDCRLTLGKAVSTGPLFIILGFVAFIIGLILRLRGYDYMSFITNYIVLAFLCGWAGIASVNSVRILTHLVSLNIVRLRSYLDEVARSEKIPEEFFWSRMIKEYLELDAVAITVFARVSSIVALVVSVGLSVAWFFFIVGRVSFANSPGFGACSYCISALACVYVLSLLYPLARVNSLRHSLESAEPSLLTASLRCAAIPMPGDQNAKYIKFLEVVGRCALGAKLPFIGMITTSDIVNYAKIIACVLPAVLSYSIIFVDN